jgi:phage baseplate assembly protein V
MSTHDAHLQADLSRRIENLLSIGTIAAVDNGAMPPQVKLRIAGRETGWMPVPGHVGCNWRGWFGLRVGTQVLAGCPSGDPAQAVIIQILYTTAGANPLPPPEVDEAVDVIQWDDGTQIRYDSAARKLRIFSVGDLALIADGTLVVEGGNIVTRVRDGGTLHTDHAGKASSVTHKGGALFDSEKWEAGADVIDKGDHGFSPPKVTSPAEGG